MALLLSRIMMPGVLPLSAIAEADEPEAPEAVELSEQPIEAPEIAEEPTASPTPEPTPVPEPDYTFTQESVRLVEILEATGRSITENATLSVDNDRIRLAETEIETEDEAHLNLETVTVTVTGAFAFATLSITQSSGVQTITMAYKPQKPALAYTFANEDDTIKLLALLKENGIDTEAIVGTEVVEGDGAALALLETDGECYVGVVQPFDRIVLRVTTQEGLTLDIALSLADGEAEAAPAVEHAPAGLRISDSVYLSGDVAENVRAEAKSVSANVRGGAICVADGEINVSGGTMKNNSADEGGAIYFASSATLTVSGGSIGVGTEDSTTHETLTSAPNTAYRGAGVYMASGTANITGGSISYNRAIVDPNPQATDAGGCGGGIYALNAYVNVNGANAKIAHNTAANNGGAVFVEEGAAATLGTGTTTGSGAAIRSCEASKGGAVYLNGTGDATSGGGELTIGTGATVRDCTATTTEGDGGAGIYLYEGSRLYLSGAPVFDNNKAPISSTSGKNGGESVYTDGKARQDIFIKNFMNAGSTATSLVVTGNITAPDGSIWVWAQRAAHYKQSTQFAVMEGGTHDGLTAFRNAQKDDDTDNPYKNDDPPMYLTGIARGNNLVYWTGSMDLTVTEVVTGEFADENKDFTFTISVPDSGATYNVTRFASISATTGTSGTLTANGSGVLTFTLKHDEKIIVSIPSGTQVTLTEVNYGYYHPSYVLGTAASVNGASVSVKMDNDTTVAFTNMYNAVSPSGVSFRTLPFILILSMSALLVPVVIVGRRRRKEEEA